MPLALLLVVACIWAVFTLPPLVADRRLVSGRRVVTSRSRIPDPGQADGSSSPNPRPSSSLVDSENKGNGRRTILARRRRVLMVLVAAAVASLVGLVTIGGTWLVGFHVAMDVMLVCYVMMLRRIQKLRQDRELIPSLTPFQPDGETISTPLVKVVQSG